MERWDRAGRWAAYGAALALFPYVVIKVSWVVGSLLGVLPIGDGVGTAEWVGLNTVTIGLAGIGIALALALVRPWGMRIPGVLVAFCAWVGSGFLVSVLPFVVLAALLEAGGDGARGGESAMPVWEGVLIQCSFLGTGVGLAVAVPAYLRRRWPRAFAGRVGDGDRVGVPWAAVVGAGIGVVWLYWAVGGTVGIAHSADRNANWYALGALSAFWTLAASAAVWTIARARPARLPRTVPLIVGWIGSGSLFAWSAWKLPLTLYVAWVDPADVTPPENPAVAAVLHLCAAVAGGAMLRTVVRTRAGGAASNAPGGVTAREIASTPSREAREPPGEAGSRDGDLTDGRSS